MSSTFDIFSFKTIPSNYSWDKGTPTLDYNEFVTDVTSCTATSQQNEDGIEYIGYAPYVFVTLSSAPGDVNSSFLNLKRSVNFGDYYNNETNIITTPTLSSELFGHTYIMPGLYSLELNRTEYKEVTLKDYPAYGTCLQKYCIDWKWASTTTNTLSVTWSSSKKNKSYEKKWKFEPCDTDWAALNGLHVNKIEGDYPQKWQWYHYLSNSNNNLYNTPLTWSQTEFDQSATFTWQEAAGPCINLRQSEQVIWRWNNIIKEGNQFTDAITWNETKITQPGNITWNFVKNNCISSLAPLISSTSETIKKKAFLRVKEIPPVAYIRALNFNSTVRETPITIRLTARDTVCGSFPIEKIIWDLGDGSPLLTQRRWSNVTQTPFVFTGAISEDYQDPRNFDVEYTYRTFPSKGFSYYPSLTAYASSTGSSDCAATIIGPLKLSNTNGNNIKIIQNELTDYGKVLIGEISNGTDATLAVWRAD